MFGGTRPLAAALILMGALAVLAGPPAQGQSGPPPCTEPCQRPDALVRRYSEAGRDGDGIYNRDSLGQTRVSMVLARRTARFVVRVENDGSLTDDLVLAGTRNTDTFFIRYFVGQQEVSARMRAGTYRFPAVPPGSHRAVVVEVQARAAAKVGNKVIARVAVRSGALPARLDRVKMVVYRSGSVATPIEGRTYTTRATAERWARNEGATSRFVLNARLYWELAPSRGIRPEVAYAQSAKETAHGNFGGVLGPSFRNSCGLKTTAGGDDSDPNAHQRFATWRQGVIACIDHLALYAGAPGYPRAVTPDPRHFSSVYATAPTVESLGGRWAPAGDYGRSIVRDYLNPLLGS